MDINWYIVLIPFIPTFQNTTTAASSEGSSGAEEEELESINLEDIEKIMARLVFNIFRIILSIWLYICNNRTHAFVYTTNWFGNNSRHKIRIMGPTHPMAKLQMDQEQAESVSGEQFAYSPYSQVKHVEQVCIDSHWRLIFRREKQVRSLQRCIYLPSFPLVFTVLRIFSRTNRPPRKRRPLYLFRWCALLSGFSTRRLDWIVQIMYWIYITWICLDNHEYTILYYRSRLNKQLIHILPGHTNWHIYLM